MDAASDRILEIGGGQVIRRPHGRVLSMFVLAAGYLVSAAACCLVTVTSPAAFGDLGIYRAAGAAAAIGTNVYRLRFAWQLQFTYPPFAAVLFEPLAKVSLPLAAGLITAATVVALPVTAYLALRLPPVASWFGRDAAVRLALAFSAAAIWLEPVRTDLKYGQINVFLALAVLADLALPDGARAKGALIGLAAGIKLTPAIFTVYLLATRRYRAAAVSAAVFGGTVAAGYAALPAGSGQYWALAFLNPGHVGRIQNVANQSLLGALARVLGTLSVQPVWLPAACAVGVAGIALAARAGRAGDDARGFALCAVTGLLISPISWSHHWVMAVPALLLATLIAARQLRSGPGLTDRAPAVRGPHHAWAVVSLVRSGWVWLSANRPAVLALSALALATVAGWARLIWRVPTGSGHYAELNLSPLQLIAADAYVLAGLTTLSVAAWPVLAAAWRRAASASWRAGDDLPARTHGRNPMRPDATVLRGPLPANAGLGRCERSATRLQSAKGRCLMCLADRRGNTREWVPRRQGRVR